MKTFKISTFFSVTALALAACSVMPNFAAAAEKPATKGIAINTVIDPIFPVKLGINGVSEGSVTVIVSVDNKGKMMDWIALSATDAEFVTSVKRVIPEWKFEPAYLNGEPIAACACITIHFKNDTVTMNYNALQMASAFLNRNIDNMEKPLVARFSDLDKIPEPVNIIQPAIDSAIPADTREGEVDITFFIDKDGRVRMPIMTESKGDPRLADAAYDALAKWQFAKPISHGEPVIVRASQKFVFKNPAPAAK
jgi:TonB family protein